MKLLRVMSNNFKNCSEKIDIDFIPKAQKNDADKEFELLQIADELFTYSTLGIVGKNASGKTTIMELLVVAYEILSSYKFDSRSMNILKYNDEPFNLDLTFYEDGFLYRYITDVERVFDPVKGGINTLVFKNERIYKKQYFKSFSSKIFDYDTYNMVEFEAYNKPDEISLLFLVFKERSLKGLYYTSNDYENLHFSMSFDIYDHFYENSNIIIPLIQMFDDNISSLKKIDDKKYEIVFKNKKIKEVTDFELHEILSSGTSKGFNLMSLAVWSLKNGIDLLVDEIEIHFHKTLVENLINLYKDKMVNKYNARLIITTHYCELLDMFGRSDNIYICHNDGKVTVDNMYLKYKTRPDLLKSKKFYNNEFGTNVKYDALMNFKKELIK